MFSKFCIFILKEIENHKGIQKLSIFIKHIRSNDTFVNEMQMGWGEVRFLKIMDIISGVQPIDYRR